ALLFLARGGCPFFAEGGARLFGEMGDGAFLFRDSGGFFDVAAGGGALFGTWHTLLAFLLLSRCGGFLPSGGTVGFGVLCGGGVGLSGQGALGRGRARFFFGPGFAGAGTGFRGFLRGP